jgi:NadR type nicotinamide-nucleotide adenylyltransferase
MKKVVIIGPESTGKSTLSAQLAEHFQTLWVPEYARDYLMGLELTYTYDDLLEIAKGQLELEEEYIRRVLQQETSGAERLLVIDTDMYVMKVWCEFVFGKCHRWILEQIAERSYDLYLLCATDLPWAPDPLREYPDPGPRRQLYNIYKDILIHQHVPWVEITGSSEQRLRAAVKAIETRFRGQVFLQNQS